METRLLSLPAFTAMNTLRGLTTVLLVVSFTGITFASPDDWIEQIGRQELTAWSCYADPSAPVYLPEEPGKAPSLSLACLPEVNVSLGENGFAIINPVMLVPAPDYPPFQYVVDIMGPLTNTVYCEQLGQELMVVVTELPTGNSCMSTIFVEDKLKPTLVCTPDTLPCNIDIEDIDFESTLEAVIDNCDPSPDVWSSYVIQNLPCNPNHFTQQILVTWTATDASGNSATCQDVIYLKKPSLGEITFPADVTMSCVNANTDPSVTGEPTYNGLPITYACQISVWHTDVPIPMCTGSYKIKRKWTVMDWCNSGQLSDEQIILVTDNTPPNITCPPNVTLNTGPGVCYRTYVLPPPVSVSDACAPASSITISIQIAGLPGYYSPGQSVNLGVGTTLITMKATDPCGNTRICQYNVTVKDNTPPIISCPGNVTVSCTGSTDPASTGTATATDFCDATPTITHTDVTVASSDCGLGYKINRTWKATDDSGNSACCTQMITLTDNVPPVITCPINVTIGCTTSTAPTTTGSATATDMCDPTPTITFTDMTIGGTCPQEKTIKRTWKATDDCNNSSTCVQNISVEDNTPPTITCPPNLTVMCASGTLPPGTGTATATDICDATPTITFSDVTASGGNGQGTITRTWSASDDCGNSSTCIQLILITDNTPPTITCPANITVVCTASTLPPATGTATATDNCAMQPMITFTDVSVAGGCPQEGTITRTWKATDAGGNTSTCIQIVVIDDNAGPAMICPVNVTISCTTSTAPASTGGMASATDNCDPTPTITFTDITTNGSCPQAKTISRTWKATDDCGNMNSCVQTIQIVDNVVPVITCPPNTTVNCTASTLPPATGTATATDNCDGTPTITFTDVTVGSCPNDYIITRTWRATDDCGNSSTCNQIIVKDDTTPPTCVTQNITVQLGGNGVVTITPQQVDNGSSDACSPVTLSVNPSTFDCQDLGENIVTLTVTDCSGNSSTCTAIVTVEEGDMGLQANCQNVVKCLDGNGNAVVTPEEVNNGSGGGCNPGMLTFMLSQTNFNCSNIGPNIVTLTVSDSQGNSATCTAVVTINDCTPPTITCPANVTVECQTVGDPNNTGQFGNATASDNCPPAIITETHELNLNTCNIGTIIRTFTATDPGGNTATCTQTVTIINSNPLDAGDITWPPSPINVNICNSTDPQNIPNGFPVINPSALACADVDITYSDQTVMNVDNNPNTPCKVITRTWTVVDNCQQNATFTFVQTINVQDMVPPLFTNINDMTKTANANCEAFFTLIASATDCAGVTITNNSPYSDNGTGANASGFYPVGVTTVIFTATDGCGNISTMDVVITVVDPNPTEFECEKVIAIMPAEGEIAISAGSFITIIPGNCTDPEDFIFSFSDTDPYDSIMVFNCGDIGVIGPFPIYAWLESGPTLFDSCTTADLELCDPNGVCPGGPTPCSNMIVVEGEVMNESGLPIHDVEVTIANTPVAPDMTNNHGYYHIGGLQAQTGYEIMPVQDQDHKAGVSTLDLVLIQKHLLGRAKLGSPYKMIAADANKSGTITAVDLLEIRKLILGIIPRFTNNTSWRFVDRQYQFPDPYNPFTPGFPETVWFDSITHGIDTANFVGVKIGDVNGSFFNTKVGGDAIEPRGTEEYGLSLQSVAAAGNQPAHWELEALPGQGEVEGLQFSLVVGPYGEKELAQVTSDIIPADHWYFDPITMSIRVSWTPVTAVDVTGKALLRLPRSGGDVDMLWMDYQTFKAEAYQKTGEGDKIRPIHLMPIQHEDSGSGQYQLFQNIPNPFMDGTIIRFALPGDENVRLIVRDLTGRTVTERSIPGVAGLNEIEIRKQELGGPGIYYYTLKTLHANLTRKMSYTNN